MIFLVKKNIWDSCLKLKKKEPGLRQHGKIIMLRFTLAGLPYAHPRYASEACGVMTSREETQHGVVCLRGLAFQFDVS